MRASLEEHNNTEWQYTINIGCWFAEPLAVSLSVTIGTGEMLLFVF